MYIWVIKSKKKYLELIYSFKIIKNLALSSNLNLVRIKNKSNYKFKIVHL
jgi:hypothetical protein